VSVKGERGLRGALPLGIFLVQRVLGQFMA